MSRDLQVQKDQLGRFAHALGESVTSLGEARRALEHVRADQLGTNELDEACDGFQERWKYGAGQLGERISGIHEGVKAGHLIYTEIDRAIAAAFTAVAADG
ncbi:hypothetical protein [Streptomyces sp. NPDC000410]|uniref:hypothetical protein n=1 Tax=Streptomyces sp. NPDC000410 TaxID=3154254 RepID=UPI003331BD2B